MLPSRFSWSSLVLEFFFSADLFHKPDLLPQRPKTVVGHSTRNLWRNPYHESKNYLTWKFDEERGGSLLTAVTGPVGTTGP